MFTFAHTAPVNPPGATPKVSREVLWRVLMMKAEDATPFISIMESCKVLERTEDGLIREVRILGETFKERLMFLEPDLVYFGRFETQGVGWDVNAVSEDPDGLQLTISMGASFPDAVAGSDRERQRGEQIVRSLPEVVDAVIQRARELAANG